MWGVLPPGERARLGGLNGLARAGRALPPGGNPAVEVKRGSPQNRIDLWWGAPELGNSAAPNKPLPP